jgi:hypothetical protein
MTDAPVLGAYGVVKKDSAELIGSAAFGPPTPGRG